MIAALRDVYQDHLPTLLDLLTLPGKARRSTPSGEITIDEGALPMAGPRGPATGLDPAKIDGIVVDDVTASLIGDWTEGNGLKGYVGYGYRYASPGSGATAKFTIRPTRSGRFELRFYTRPHENRSTKTPITVRQGDLVRTTLIDQRQGASDDWIVIDRLDAEADRDIVIEIGTESADGFVHVDAVSLVEVK